MPEGAPQPNSQEKNAKRSPALEAGAFVATLLSALNHGPAQALEIDPHTSWIVGVEDSIYPSVMEERVEHATVFVQYAGGSAEWVPPTKGLWDKVSVPLEADAGNALEQGRGRQVIKMCEIHTHPLATSRRAFKLQRGEPHNPPSPQDILLSGYTKPDYQAGGVVGADVIQAVFDPHGVWYYRQAIASDYSDPRDAALQKELNEVKIVHSNLVVPATVHQQEVRQRFMDTWRSMSNFVLSTVDAKTVPQSDYKALENEYLKGWGAKIRFVPWDKIPKEPACAGPDYDPKKGMLQGRKTLN